MAAANRDSEHWDSADKFDIRRNSIGHVAFGTGIHACVGRQVARQETHAILHALIEHVDKIELTGDPTWQPGNSLTTLESLPISLIAKVADKI